MTKAVIRFPDRRRWEDYARLISTAWQKSVEGIIETGRLLIEAKANLDHGEFEAMVQLKLPFVPRTAQRLMEIARNPVISKATHGSYLPPSWRTLYDLTKLPDETLRAKIADGTITPKMERKDVAVLRGKSTPASRPKRTRMKRLPPFEPLIDCVADVVARVEEVIVSPIGAERRAHLFRALREALDKLEAKAARVSKREEANGEHPT